MISFNIELISAYLKESQGFKSEPKNLQLGKLLTGISVSFFVLDQA